MAENESTEQSTKIIIQNHLKNEKAIITLKNTKNRSVHNRFIKKRTMKPKIVLPTLETDTFEETINQMKKFKARKFNYDPVEVETVSKKKLIFYQWVSSTPPMKLNKKKVEKEKDEPKCEVCNKIFSERRNLNRHMNIHKRKNEGEEKQ